jgi:hypothetical protein
VKYVEATCVCCKGEWRARVALPRASKRHRYLTTWDFKVICGRCNIGDCSRPVNDLRAKIGCNEGRRDAA